MRAAFDNISRSRRRDRGGGTAERDSKIEAVVYGTGVEEVGIVRADLSCVAIMR